MGKQKFMLLVKNTQMVLSKHSPEILTGIGVAGMITTTVLACKATPKALMLLENAAHDKGEDLTKSEEIKAAWKPYVPAVVIGAISIACLFGANSVNARRNAVLATAYNLSETALSEYKDKVIESIGEKKEQVIQDKVAKEHIEKNPPSTNDVYITEKGNTLCYDVISGRYFKCDIDKIRKAENVLNKRMLNGDMYVSVNEFYDELNIPHTAAGYELGWTVDKGLIDIYLSAQLTDDDQPCVVLNYHVAPKYGYDKLT